MRLYNAVVELIEAKAAAIRSDFDNDDIEPEKEGSEAMVQSSPVDDIYELRYGIDRTQDEVFGDSFKIGFYNSNGESNE